jgi:tRNA A-37 threonylcarbamoyl transferase component Bud32
MGTRLIIVESDMTPILAASGLRSYEDFVTCEAGEPVSRSGTTQTRRLRFEGGGGRDYFLKVYRYEGHRWRHRFRRDKSAVEAENFRVLRERCRIDVPDVIAHGARRDGLRLRDAFLMTRAVGSASASVATLDALFSTRWPDANRAGDDPLREALLHESAALVGRIHACGFCHIDLQWRNILVLGGLDAGLRLFVIDTPRGGIRMPGPRRLHGQMRDLSSLYKEARLRLRRTEQLRWLQRCLQGSRLQRGQKELIRTILRDRALKDNGPAK